LGAEEGALDGRDGDVRRGGGGVGWGGVGWGLEEGDIIFVFATWPMGEREEEGALGQSQAASQGPGRAGPGRRGGVRLVLFILR
jgi:hypothetical protein